MSTSAAEQPSNSAANNTVLAIILATSMGHFLNDMMQSLLPAIYPMLKREYSSNILADWLAHIYLSGDRFDPTAYRWHLYRSSSDALLIAFWHGLHTRWSNPACNGTSLYVPASGAAFIGFGSSVFHPEAARVARLASGGRHGFAQSMFPGWW